MMHLFDFLPPSIRGLSFDFQDIMSLTFLSMTVIQVVPIKINPWSSLLRWFGRIINADINVKVDDLNRSLRDLKDKYDNLYSTYQRDMAVAVRVRILRFGDEISRGIKHSEESFEQALYDIDFYEKYCIKHPEFKNNQTVVTAKMIKDVFEKCLKNHEFI